VIDSNVGAAEATFIVGRVEINVTGAYTREESAQRRVRQGSLSTGLGVRF
jgi:hypothetical protein